MDPTPLTSSEWSELGKVLTSMWLMVALVIFFSTNLMVGHILIPSLVASYHLPQSLQKARVGFYALGIAGFAATLVVLAMAIDHAGVIADIFETYWIDGGVD
jgi:hypothetical protein